MARGGAVDVDHQARNHGKADDRAGLHAVTEPSARSLYLALN